MGMALEHEPYVKSYFAVLVKRHACALVTFRGTYAVIRVFAGA
jgi:hypothetical protein